MLADYVSVRKLATKVGSYEPAGSLRHGQEVFNPVKRTTVAVMQ